MIEMTIDSIRVSLMNYQRVVILKEKLAKRYLPIWIGPSEADAIAVKLQGVTVPRPLTHDLLSSVIDSLGADIDSIIVSDLKSDTFYAKIILSVNSERMEYWNCQSLINRDIWNNVKPTDDSDAQQRPQCCAGFLQYLLRQQKKDQHEGDGKRQFENHH